jgi:hypothetical protein
MKTIRAAIFLSIFSSCFWGSPARAQASDIAVVVNDSNGAGDLTLGELRRCFMGERRSWAVGMPIRLLVRESGTPERKALLKLMGMSEHEYKEYWIAEIFRGEVDAEPLALPTLALESKALAIFRGAIALVDSSHIEPGMKVLKVGGLLPGEPGYPLH